MARKKIEPITSLGNEDKLTVQKSLPLFALWRSELTLPEFKILDTYLSRINSLKPEKRAVMFEKGELEKILGVKKINNQDLQVRLKHLMGNVIEIPDESTKKGFRLVTLFEEAVAEQDARGLWQVRLECTQKAMKYFFNIENLGYLRYKLRCITSLTSRYTYIMFIYLEANRYRKSWNVPLDELKQILDCANEEYAKEFKYFNRDVLKKVQKEMHKKTECRYNYEPIKKGRSVVAIQFTVETLPKASLEDIDPNQYTIEEYLDRAFWETALDGWAVSAAQIAQIKELLEVIPDEKMPHPKATEAVSAREMQKYQYIRLKVAEIDRRDAAKRIKDKCAYLIKVMEREAIERKSTTNGQAPAAPGADQNRFNNFHQRSYTAEQYAAIEEASLR